MELRLLVSSAGRRLSLLECFIDAAGSQGIDLTLLGTDTNPDWSAACAFSDRAYEIPPADDPRFINVLSELITREGQVQLLIPTLDSELTQIAKNKDTLKKLGTHTVISSPETIDICYDRLKTADFLKSAGIRSPKTYDPTQIPLSMQLPYPLIAKQRFGSETKEKFVIHNDSELDAVRTQKDYILQNQISGTEFTISLYFNFEGQLRCAIPHERVTVRAGEVEKAITRRNEELESIAKTIGERFAGKAFGPLDVQAVIDDRGKAWVIEMNPHFGSSYPLAHRAGARFTHWILEEITGEECSASNNWKENIVMVKADRELFLEGQHAIHVPEL